jgi:hypothetical protein
MNLDSLSYVVDGKASREVWPVVSDIRHRHSDGIKFRVWSVFEAMKEFDAYGLAMLLHHIDEKKAMASKMVEISEGVTEQGMMADEIDQFVLPILHAAQHHAIVAHLDSAHSRVWHGGGAFYMQAIPGFTYRQFLVELTVLRQSIEDDLMKRFFVFVEPKKHELLVSVSGEDWADVFKVLPECKPDVLDAHLARMVELDTATVFHMMRVAEFGLRRMAKQVKVKLTHKGHPMPIEFADWEKVIVAIKNKIDKVRQTKIGPTRAAQLEMYSDAADHCVFMKDIWRNNISHVRKPYKPSEALAVIERVRDFMRFIATNFK